MELYGKRGYETRVEEQKILIRERAKSFGWKSTKILDLCERMQRDADKARVIWDAALDCPIPSNNGLGSLREFLDSPHFETLGTELVLEYKDPRWPRTPLLAQLDRLMFNPRDNTLIIPDLKTTSKSPRVRLASCPWEYQNRLYTHIVESLLEDGTLQAHFKIPPQTRLKAFVHIALRKPTIALGPADRDFTTHEHTLRSGPRKDQIELRKEYVGEPRWANYLERVKQQFYGTGEYENLAEFRKTDPSVNFSWTWVSTITDDDRSEFRQFTNAIYKLATARPYPVLFPRNGANMETWNDVDILAPFYATHPSQWPAIIRHLNLVQHWREDDITAKIGVLE